MLQDTGPTPLPKSFAIGNLFKELEETSRASPHSKNQTPEPSNSLINGGHTVGKSLFNNPGANFNSPSSNISSSLQKETVSAYARNRVSKRICNEI